MRLSSDFELKNIFYQEYENVLLYDLIFHRLQNKVVIPKETEVAIMSKN